MKKFFMADSIICLDDDTTKDPNCSIRLCDMKLSFKFHPNFSLHHLEPFDKACPDGMILSVPTS
jgi:hypothetical protein